MSEPLLVASAPGVEFGAMPGLDAGWSRTVSVPDADGIPRTWHILDNGVEPSEGTLLCVHGNPTWSYLWRRFLASAEPGWRVVAVDQLGMGYSERLKLPRTLAQRIDDLDTLTEALGVAGRVVIAAHDWGGPISLGWAERHRDELAGVILANTGVSVPAEGHPPLLIRLARSRVLHDVLCVRTSTFVRGAAWLSGRRLKADVRTALQAPYASPERRRAVGDFVADIPVSATHPSRAALHRVLSGLGNLSGIPVLLLWGPRDPVFSQAFLRDLERRLPQADIHRYAGASHLVTEDVPETADHAWTWIRTRVSGQLQTPGEQPSGPSIDIAAVDGPTTAISEQGRGPSRLTTFTELDQRIDLLAETLRRQIVESRTLLGERLAAGQSGGDAGAAGPRAYGCGLRLLACRRGNRCCRYRLGLAPYGGGAPQRRPGVSDRSASRSRGRRRAEYSGTSHCYRRSAEAGPSRVGRVHDQIQGSPFDRLRAQINI